MSFLSIIDTYTRHEILPGVVDNVFKHGALAAYLKRNNVQTYPGGGFIQENFRYAGLKGGYYPKGATFDITQQQHSTGLRFSPKQIYVNVTELLEDLNIYVRGPGAPFKLVEEDMKAAADTMAAFLGISIYLPGTGTGFVNQVNGLAQAISDGTTNSFNGSTYASYGEQTRNTAPINSALNAKVTNVNGPVSYNVLNKAWFEVNVGQEAPVLGVTTNLGLTYIYNRFQPQQLLEGTDGNIGFSGIKFNAKATIVHDNYAPGTLTKDDEIVKAFAAQQGFTYPTLSGESFWWINPGTPSDPYIRLFVSDDPLFGFGFTGFKRAQNSTTVAGQYLAALNLAVPAPRLQHQLYNITG